MVPVSQKRDDAVAAYNLKRSELDLLLKSATDLKESIVDASKELELAKTMLSEKKANMSRLEKERKELETKVPNLEAELTQVTKKLDPLEEQVSTRRVKLEERRSASQQVQTQNSVLQALQEQSRRGKLKGFYGRLGSLGTIDDKYDCAVTTACGALNHLVVDTVEQGQWCVEFLRKHNVGRATFIILEKISHLKRHAESPFSGPAPRLFDLICIKVIDSFLSKHV